MFATSLATGVALHLLTLLFQVDSRVIVAVEDGPVILEVSLKYVGNQDLFVFFTSYDSPYGVHPPTEWGPCLAKPYPPRFISGNRARCIKPGETLVRLVCPTSDFVCQPKTGVCEMNLSGRLALITPNRNATGQILLPTISRRVTVEPMTPAVEARLLAMVRDGVAKINSGRLDSHEVDSQRRLLEHIVLSCRGELGRVLALDLLQDHPSSGRFVSVAGSPYELNDRRLNAIFAHLASAHPYLVSELLRALAGRDVAAQHQSARRSAACFLFKRAINSELWADRLIKDMPLIIGLLFPPPPLSENHVARIAAFAASHSPDAAILVHSAFRTRLSMKSKAQLEAAIARGISAKSTVEMKRHISQLEADDFGARGKAVEYILAHLTDGPLYDLVIAEQSRPNLSAEAEYRLAQILRDKKGTNTAILRAEVFDQIHSGGLSEDIDTLKIIASGNDEVAIVLAAKAQLKVLQSKSNK